MGLGSRESLIHNSYHFHCYYKLNKIGVRDQRKKAEWNEQPATQSRNVFLDYVSHSIFIFLILVPVLDWNCYNQRKSVLSKTCFLISQLSFKQFMLTKLAVRKTCLYLIPMSGVIPPHSNLLKEPNPFTEALQNSWFWLSALFLFHTFTLSLPSGPHAGIPILDLACQKPLQDRILSYYHLVSTIPAMAKKRCFVPEHWP